MYLGHLSLSYHLISLYLSNESLVFYVTDVPALFSVIPLDVVKVVSSFSATINTYKSVSEG